MLSVVIATNDSEQTLVPTLAALVAGAAEGLIAEVIVADAGSRDQTAEVADIAGCRFVVIRGTLGQRLDAATALARAPWLMFLRSGVVLETAWMAEVRRFIADVQAGTDDRAAVFRPAPAKAYDPPSMLAEAFRLVRAALWSSAHPERGLLITKRLYRQLGGYRPEAADPERDLLRRLGTRRTILLPCAAVKLAERPSCVARR